MVRHVILWTLKEEFTGEQMEVIKRGIKEGLEGLQGRIPGLVEIKVNLSPLKGSTCDLMLDSLFEDEEALKNYSTHPAHVETANGKVRPFTDKRMCLNYEV